MFEGKRTKEFLRLLSFMKHRMVKYIIGIAGETILSSSRFILLAFIFKDAINSAVQKDMVLFVRAIFLLVGLTLSLCIFSPIFGFIINKCVKTTMFEIRVKVLKHVTRLPISFFESHHSGDTVSRLVNDIQAMEYAFMGQIQTIMFAVTVGVGSLIAMYIINWQLSVVIIILGILSAYINTRFIAPLRKVSDEIQSKLGSLTERFTDILNGLDIIKLFPAKTLITERFNKENDKLVATNISKIHKASCLESSNYILSEICYVVVFIVAAFMALNGRADFGTVIALQREKKS